MLDGAAEEEMTPLVDTALDDSGPREDENWALLAEADEDPATLSADDGASPNERPPREDVVPTLELASFDDDELSRPEEESTTPEDGPATEEEDASADELVSMSDDEPSVLDDVGTRLDAAPEEDDA